MPIEKKIKNVMIVSLSSGILGESFVAHELKLGVKRLEELGLNVRFSQHARMGLDYLKPHPESRADDLVAALQDDTVDMILCAIGGDDTYRLLPYLFEDDRFKNAVRKKVFLGFSDTTVNHLMLYKVGLNTFYGQAFLPDICELGEEMLPYTLHYFRELVETGRISRITPSEYWYEERTDFSEAAMGTPLTAHKASGYELLRGASVFSGKILGGCIDTLFDLFDGTRYADSPSVCSKYQLFPEVDDWKGRILLLETSEEQPTPERYRAQIRSLKSTGVFDAVNGLLCGRPMNQRYADEYKAILLEELPENLPIVWNVNVGHAQPRCIIPFGIPAVVDVNAQEITFDYAQEASE